MCNIPDVIKNCKEYIHVLQQCTKGSFLTRGLHDNNIDIKNFTLSIVERKPLHMPHVVHLALNAHFEKIFGWPIRNGLFSFGVKENHNQLIDLGYGQSYLLFPCGNFKYVCDANIFDLYETYYKYYKSNVNATIESFIDSLNYSDNNLDSVITNVLCSDRGAEIMINCESYYLINVSYIEELRNLIWNN